MIEGTSIWRTKVILLGIKTLDRYRVAYQRQVKRQVPALWAVRICALGNRLVVLEDVVQEEPHIPIPVEYAGEYYYHTSQEMAISKNLKASEECHDLGGGSTHVSAGVVVRAITKTKPHHIKMYQCQGYQQLARWYLIALAVRGRVE